jgi:signal transduction histidine kinase
VSLPGLGRLDRWTIALAFALAVGTLLVVILPQLSLVLVDPRLDLVINTAATLAAVSVSTLAWARYREAQQPQALYQASAFAVLALSNGLWLIAVLLHFDREAGISLAAPGELPIYVQGAGRLLAAVLLLAGALSVTPSWLRRQSARTVMLVPMGLVLLVAVLGFVFADRLPPLMGERALVALRQGQTLHAKLPGPGLALLLLDTAIGGLYLAATLLYLRMARGQEGAVSSGYLAIGLMIAAFSQLHLAIHPGTYTSLVTTGDVLRVAFYAILLVGLTVERRADIRELRQANGELRRLHDAELATAALEERARLAREIHDGLAQDLWYAKLKQGRLIRLGSKTDEGDQLASEVATAIDSALAEARQAVMAMRPQPEEASFGAVIGRYVEDFGDRFGLRAEFELEGEGPALSARAQAELLRILQEALNNVRKHADATVVRVRVSSDAGTASLAVTDNGRGFEPAGVDEGRYGLQSMRERAELIGGRLAVDSHLQDGTRVRVDVPIEEEGR